MVSVIIPAFNAGKTVGRCLNSIVDQSFQDWEAVVINDGSTDDTESILATYNDSRIRIVSISNNGVSHARNVGIDMANGEFVTFIDSDDYIDPLYLEVLIKTAGDTDCVKCGYFIENESGKLLSTNVGGVSMSYVWGGYIDYP